MRLKAEDLNEAVARHARFNSKLVRLKGSGIQAGASILRVCFNSKLVRLKARQPDRQSTVTSKFQFQTGAIKSRRASANDSAMALVSIPNWCD